MIDLLSVKLNGDYDFIQGAEPTESGTWLCTDDLTGYTKGYSYSVEKVTGGIEATRIEAKEDYLITAGIYPMIEEVCNYLNNFFYVKRQTDEIIQDTSLYNDLSIEDNNIFFRYTSIYGNFALSQLDITGITNGIFRVGDLIQLRNAKRNNYVSYVTDVAGNVVTIDNSDFINTTEDILIMLMNLPQSVQKCISALVHYNVFIRDGASNLQSENIGNYSYSKATVNVGGLYYPAELINPINNIENKRVRFV